MAEKRTRRFKFDERVRQILLHDWDPIGVGYKRECQDEYDSYIGGVQSLLMSGVSPEKVARHLALLESGPMGLPSSVDANMAVAKKLCALNLKDEIKERAV
jgi:hypothetical protein